MFSMLAHVKRKKGNEKKKKNYSAHIDYDDGMFACLPVPLFDCAP
jgi:hypothetical protein